MKRFTDYKGMYHEMLVGSEKAINLLSNCSETGAQEAIVSALRILIDAQRSCEDIYIDSSENNLVYLTELERPVHPAQNQ